MLTPLGWLAARVETSPRALRWASTASLVVAVLVVLGGGTVRVTGSGLGCPTWPTCEGTSIAPIPELGLHGVIEFANRLVTVVLIVAVAAVIVTARTQRPRDRALTRLAWSQFWVVVANAIAGGITVLARLNPWLVAVHFLLAFALLTTATLTWHRARTAAPSPRATPRIRALARTLVGATLVLVVIGTVVSGAGPHSGDSAAVHRIAVNWTVVAVVHGVLGTVVLLLGVGMLLLTRRAGLRTASRRATAFVLVVLLQAALGIYQALAGVPELAVALHVLGSALVWIGVLRVLLDTDTALFAVRESDANAAVVRRDTRKADAGRL